MRFHRPLVRGVLLRRYKRFLADVTLEDGREVVAHCPNPGAMTGLAAPGEAVWLEPAADPRRKLRWSWRLVELAGGGWAGIDTALPNRVVGEALEAGAIPELAGYERARPEVLYGARSRVDFLLSGEGRADCYLEVKNVHLRREGRLAEFPDSVTKRGARHLDELGDMAAQGARAVTLYLVQRTDCDEMGLAADIDPAYAAAFLRARERGVEAIARSAYIDREGVRMGPALPIRPPG
ncbi:MAG: DNA/RNA nuclease SfsA [Pseudomonadota bacterium]